ncbi:MAG: hypothetical protein EU549_05245 [Promethearchaeota archaeon]|nr:MAG: hypothetical protein EU549_05245 [Candidatus Lokiarchaeota archaeon]
MKIDEELLMISQDLINSEDKMRKISILIIKLMRVYDQKYNEEEVVNYLIFLLGLLLDNKYIYNKIGVSVNLLDKNQKKMVKELLMYEKWPNK